MDANQTIFLPSSQPSVYALSMQQMQQAQQQVQQQQVAAAVAQRLAQQQQHRSRPEHPKLLTSYQKQAQDIFTSPPASALDDFTLGQTVFAGNNYFSDIDYSPLTPKSSEPSFSPAEFAADSDLDSWPNVPLPDPADTSDDFGYFAKTESTTSPVFFSSSSNTTSASAFPMQSRSLFETSAINPLQLSKDGAFSADLIINQQPKQEIMDEEFGLFGSSPSMSSSMQQQQQQQQQSLDTVTIPRDARGAVCKPSSGSRSRIASDASSSGRKRKTSSMSSFTESSATPQSPPAMAASSSSKQGSAPHGQSRKKTAHNVIEKRYRTNLNDKILALRDAVPSLRVTKDRKCKQAMPLSDEEDGYDNGETTEELGGLLPAHKLNKATILGKATEYIGHLEKQNDYLERYIVSLECTLRGLQEQSRQ